MERLTEKGFNYSDAAIVENMRMVTVSAAMNRLAAYEDTGLEPEEVAYFLGTTMSVKEAKTQYAEHKKRYDEWFAWKQAEQEGRLQVLPCKIGDMVYYLRGLDILGDTVERIILDGIDNQVLVGAHKAFMFCDFGRNVFRTREEAEAALKEREGT